MANEDFSNLRRQVEMLNNKVDGLYRKVDLICSDLDVDHGMRVNVQLNEILNYLKSVNRDLTEGQMTTMRFKIDSVMKSIEFINSKIGGPERLQ